MPFYLTAVKLRMCYGTLSIRISTIFFRILPLPLPLGFEVHYINFQTVTDPFFEAGVVKIQNGNDMELSSDESEACQSLLLRCENDVGQVSSVALTMAEKLLAAGKRNRMEASRKYRNCHFILGSAAEVERLWSICNYILTDHRKSLTAVLFESLVFLKVNVKFWDLNLVCEAMRSVPDDDAEDE